MKNTTLLIMAAGIGSRFGGGIKAAGAGRLTRIGNRVEAICKKLNVEIAYAF